MFFDNENFSTSTKVKNRGKSLSQEVSLPLENSLKFLSIRRKSHSSNILTNIRTWRGQIVYLFIFLSCTHFQ